MAAYTDLFNLYNDSALKNRVRVASIIAAETVMTEDGGTTNHANRLIWAKKVFQNSAFEAKRMLLAVLAANNMATIANIISATDTAIQINVDDHIDLFADGS